MSYKIIARSLNNDELIMSERVFAGTLTPSFLKSKVMISNGLGAGDRPFTSVVFGKIGSYQIFLGPDAFSEKRINMEYKAMFVHEMTHVWQMHNESFFGWVWLDSLASQACHQGNVYLYSETSIGQPWGRFSVEQQAKIVEDWFRNGLKGSDKRFPYIKNNVRKGRTGYVSDTASETA